VSRTNHDPKRKRRTTGCRRRRSTRRATALLVCIFVVAVTTVLVVTMVDSQMLQMTAQRNTVDYERALYLAGPGVHHALAQLEEAGGAFEPFSLGPIEFPSGSGNTYQADAVEVGDDIVITASGTTGDVTRHVAVTVATQ